MFACRLHDRERWAASSIGYERHSADDVILTAWASAPGRTTRRCDLTRSTGEASGDFVNFPVFPRRRRRTLQQNDLRDPVSPRRLHH